MNNKYLPLLLLLSACTTFSFATKYYVTPEGNDSNDGLSWSAPKTLNGILTSNTLVEGDEIFVKKGTYTTPDGKSFTCNKAAISVYGNCEGTETEKPVYDLGNIQTFLKSNGNNRVLYFNTASAFYGFDISDGDASLASPQAGRAGGVYVDNADGKIEYCIIHDNVGMDEAKKAGLGGVGGGVYLVGTAENCIIKNNVAGNGATTKRGVGSGIRMDGANAKLVNCIVSGNKSVTEDSQVYGSILGGGVSATGGLIVNCLIVNNETGGFDNNGNYGGGIDLTLAANQVQIINCTLADNHVSGKGGGIGFKADQEKHVYIKNCIVWDNTARASAAATNNISELSTESPATLQYTLWKETESENGNNNLNADPLLSSEYKLRTGSPAINAGDNSVITYATDLAGRERIIAATVDLGAYEYDETVDGEGGTETSIDMTDTNDVIVSTQYYTLSGLLISRPDRPGIYIEKTVYASKKTKTQKIFIPAQ